MNPLTLSATITTLLTGTMIVTFSSHWLTTWLGLEMSMFAIIPIMITPSNPRSIEATTKYFLTQVTASMILMMAILINFMHSGQLSIQELHNPLASNMILVSMMMKLGLAPFHFWVPEATQGIKLSSGMILLTWQKLAPLTILYQTITSMNTTLIMLSGILSIALGGWGGLNQPQLRKIMAYSSISHMGWMIIILTYSPTLMILNLILYITMTLSIFTMIMNNHSTTINSLSMMWNKNPAMTMLLMITLLSLGGLPPLSGFIPKWMIIQEMTKNSMIATPLIMSITALLNLYFYMRLIYTSSLTIFPSTNNMKINWRHSNPKYLTFTPTLIIMSTMILPLTPMLFILE
uniref:NADH-ubiquinone oxidoreductase chain 2 n=1 Tax=Procavia capensis TaxID=9813 RepID=Q7Y8K6_PROCA|nr:NADH dehydrogenase subunit 2 [Procavia capensis]BAC78400.1 NADH dehydrogenase subunit 2 [Procavia capensis]